ncbi:hypothetical protein GM708_06635 [Vibrio cholerae]|nr:hypothetical protein [Vibrio cholerae]
MFTYDADEDAVNLAAMTVRSEVWPQWLTIARDELASARVARDSNPGPIADASFDKALLYEYRSAMVCICAVAFMLEAFSNSVAVRYPSHSQATSPTAEGNQLSASARCHQIWTSAFRLTNVNSANTKKTLEQIFKARNAAVHASAGFVDPVQHPVYQVALEGRYVTYTVENASSVYTAAIDALDHLLDHPRGGTAEWSAWCEAMRTRLGGIVS